MVYTQTSTESSSASKGRFFCKQIFTLQPLTGSVLGVDLAIDVTIVHNVFRGLLGSFMKALYITRRALGEQSKPLRCLKKDRKHNIFLHKKEQLECTFLMGGVPFLIFSSNFMIFRSFCSSGLSVDSSTST